MKGNKKSSRVCVYLSSNCSRGECKLLGVPETESGTGEANIVKEGLEDWNMKKGKKQGPTLVG